ncbi:VWA domain-containing protein [Leptospira sp. 'Mane']|uniref:VWA domain-containing protein n=1 Tax=Leptospira sp. 'Mane' TaxID=3387407 RepID=UPI00398BB718
MNYIVDLWQKKWPEALQLWSDYVKLSSPNFILTKDMEEKEGFTTSFAAIRLTDHKVLLSLRKIKELELEDYPLEIMGHEIGHHVYCPGDLADHGKLIYLIQTAMPRFEHVAGLIVNVYTDLFINDHLKRYNHLCMEEVYRKIGKQKDPFWNFYMRTYEILWALPEETLTLGKVDTSANADAMLVNRIIRNFPNDWVRGAYDFGNICYPYFIGKDSAETIKILGVINDTSDAGKGAEIPSGITDVEIESIFESGSDPSLGGKKEKDKPSNAKPKTASLTPAQYSSICQALGIKVSQSEMAYKFYKEKALPYLVSFPQLMTPSAPEMILEGSEGWELGSPIEDINWVESVVRSPVVIPGYTTVENYFSEMPSFEKDMNPIDLDLFVDCSGSMPNPLIETSFLTLAGAIIALSALRVGSQVRTTLWSGENEYKTTKTFTRNEKDIMEILTGFIGGGTCFPLDLLKSEYTNRSKNSRKTHILIISDEGVDTMYDQQYPENPRALVKSMLEKAGGGGSMVLNLYNPKLSGTIKTMEEDGWQIYPISNWDQLIEFSKTFVKKTYERNKILHQTNR